MTPVKCLILCRPLLPGQLLVAAAASLLLASCDVIGGACTTILVPNLVAEVRDAEGRPAALGATGQARHSNGIVTELVGWDSERDGRYTVTVQKPGYQTATASAVVKETGCHVETARAPVALERDPTADAVSPIRLLQGNQVAGRPLTTSLRVFADTLEIAGAARAFCGTLRAVAYRRINQWHIQMEPERWLPPGPCHNEPARAFEVRYRLLPSTMRVLLTDPLDTPIVLFDQMVAPGGSP